jgi:tRNA (guanine-N7-)-methyltransferase
MPNIYRSLINNFPNQLITFDDPGLDIELVKSFSREGEIYCEIGSGSGGHLIALAKKNPSAKFFGFELRYKRAYRTIEKALKENVNNVFILRTDAELLSSIFSENSLNGIFVNFPDPWAKRKQQKHRLLNSEFLHKCSVLLKSPYGFISVKTDHQEYFESFRELIKQNNAFRVLEETIDLYNSHYLSSNIVTEFEQLFRSKHIPICYIKLLINTYSQSQYETCSVANI